MWWIIAYIAVLGLIFFFNKGSHSKPSELHSRDRYQVNDTWHICPRCGSTNVTQEADYCFDCKWSGEEDPE